MKIGSTHDTHAADAALRSGRAAPASTSALAQAPATEQVDVSAAGAQLGGVGGGDFDQTKVDAIRSAIREGRFTVNPERIADQLIADATALLGPRQA